MQMVVTGPDVGKVRVLDGFIRPAKDFLARIDFLAESSSDIGVKGVQPTKAESALVHRPAAMDRDRHDSLLSRGTPMVAIKLPYTGNLALWWKHNRPVK
jgi:hypothetical protein